MYETYALIRRFIFYVFCFELVYFLYYYIADIMNHVRENNVGK